MKLTKNYLTIQEIGKIVFEVCQIEEAYIREATKVAMVASYCTDMELENKTVDQIYNESVQDGIVYLLVDIVNYETLGELIKEELSVEKSVRVFLSELDKKADKLMKKLPKNITMDSLISQVKGAVK